MSTLQYDRSTDSFYLHARMRRTTDEHEQSTGVSSDAKHRTVLGVDLNVDGSLAVTSTGEFIGNADEMNHRRREFEKTRGSMQQTGTRSAHLSIQSMDDREHRWIQDELHRASNQILDEARDHGCTHVAFENLTDIRDRIAGAKRFHVGVPPFVRVRRVQSRDARYWNRAGESGVHEPAVFEVRIYPRDKSAVETPVRVSKMRLRAERGL